MAAFPVIRSQLLSRSLLLAAITASAAIVACSDGPSSPGENLGLRISSGKSTTDITVTATNPDSATQDTTLDVTITGTGFVSGTTATWALAGVPDPAQVRTNSTRVVNSRQLVANITISASATIGKWDVMAAAGSKGGIGTETFAITPKNNVDVHSRVSYVIADQVEVNGVMEQAGIRGDGRLRDGSVSSGNVSEYQGEFCGVQGAINNDFRASDVRENGDLHYDPDNGANQCGTPRYYRFNLNGIDTHSGPLSRVFGIWNIAVGQAINIGQGFGVQLPNCQTLMFNSQYGGDNLKVTRIDSGAGPRQWRVQSQGTHMAACVIIQQKGRTISVPTGVKYYLPFSIVVTEVPYPYPRYP